VRPRWVVIVFWIAAAAALTATLPTIQEAQVGALGDLVPNEATALNAELRSSELFRELHDLDHSPRLSSQCCARTSRVTTASPAPSSAILVRSTRSLAITASAAEDQNRQESWSVSKRLSLTHGFALVWLRGWCAHPEIVPPFVGRGAPA